MIQIANSKSLLIFLVLKRKNSLILVEMSFLSTPFMQSTYGKKPLPLPLVLLVSHILNCKVGHLYVTAHPVFCH